MTRRALSPARLPAPKPALLPWPVALLLALNLLPELILQLADHGLIAAPALRGLAYALGAFQPELVTQHGMFFAGQSLTMFFTYGLLHTGLFHLIINMIGLVWLGRLVLAYRSSETFLTVYLIATIGAAEMFVLIAPGGSMVGASGALFGLMGLYAVDSGLLAPRSAALPGLIARIAAATLLLVLSDIASSLLLGSAVAWEAHAGGFLTGAVIALLYPPRRVQRR